MKQMSKDRSPGTVAAPQPRDQVPARPADVISEADLDKASGGGGKAGGVVGSRAHTD